MDPYPSSAFSKQSPADYSELEMEACRGLLELKRPSHGLLESLPLQWVSKRPRSSILPICNYDDNEKKPKNAEQTLKVAEKAPPLIIKNIKIVGGRSSEIVGRAVEEEPLVKGVGTPVLTGSPTSPLFVSSHGEPSDSNNSLRLSPDLPLAPKLQFKVETKAEVHSPHHSRNLKAKRVAELKQRHDELSKKKDELEKEMKKWIAYHELLMDKNKSLKEQLVLKSEGKEADKLFIHSLDPSQQTMISLPRVRQSSLGRYIIPDLNIPLEESSDNSSGDCDNQVLKTDKFVAAAHARKYRMEYLRYKQSQLRNAQSKQH